MEFYFFIYQVIAARWWHKFGTGMRQFQTKDVSTNTLVDQLSGFGRFRNYTDNSGIRIPIEGEVIAR